MSRKIKDIPTSPLLETDSHKTKVNWIPVTEDTPTEDDDYLCTFGAETGWFVDWCSWHEGRWVWWNDDVPNPVSNVIAWCYPIEPYKGGDNMMHHYITKYEEDGQLFVEAWIQINIFGMCICLSRRKIKIER